MFCRPTDPGRQNFLFLIIFDRTEKSQPWTQNKHVTEGFLKNRKTYYSGSLEAPPIVGMPLNKIRIFSLIEPWKQHFRGKITKYFYYKEGVIRSSITPNQ